MAYRATVPPGKCCRCDGQRAKGQGYCAECKRAYRREYQKRRTQISRWHDRVRNETGKRTRKGKLKRQPCAVCGAEKVEAHHPDYRKPYDVIWLCHEHHVELERAKRIKMRATKAATQTTLWEEQSA